MAKPDGVALGGKAHPKPPWYMRPYWAVRRWRGFRRNNLETVVIELGDHDVI